MRMDTRGTNFERNSIIFWHGSDTERALVHGHLIGIDVPGLKDHPGSVDGNTQVLHVPHQRTRLPS